MTEWTLSTVPLLKIGEDATNPDAQRHNGTSAPRSRKGDIVVADSGTNETLILDAAGHRGTLKGLSPQCGLNSAKGMEGLHAQ